ncbi:tRNA-guanine transglycosylase DpdA [Hymenobacter sp. BT559]|uniref:tRNA-guanine transglycosylase DpdA n=1 Tax=Hymenobacter sp. BT559 TaxID=2795729 RepID=UPI0018EDB55A|nr:tRNA-guanine transglycosylase DpdA [Hymenobacter sp. BT559]MBJ6146295.1 hypothetical protein [Hymenobacter sp. BT559]
MKFYWPAPLDLIDPTYNFVQNGGFYGAAKHQHQLYPHEVFPEPVYHGFMISKAHAEKGYARWNSAQLNRFLREGAKRFMRTQPAALTIMGDSGAYTNNTTTDCQGHLIDQCLAVVNFYNAIGVDYGLAPDNMISGSAGDARISPSQYLDWRHRWHRTHALAETFLALYRKKSPRWQPIGVAQGWDPDSYQASVAALQQMGYCYIALGGLNCLKSAAIVECVTACFLAKAEKTEFHLLGVSRAEHMALFAQLGVTSFDSTMPMRQAVKDDKDNFHGKEGHYAAIKLPPTESSPRLQKLIRSQILSADRVQELEQMTLASLRHFDQGIMCLEDVLEILKAGSDYRQEVDYADQYRRLLHDRPWRRCACIMCSRTGIEIVLLRNRELNLRRGFHNLYVFSNKLKATFPSDWY